MPSLITAPSPYKFQTQILDLLEFNSHQIINFAGLDEDRTVFADATNAFDVSLFSKASEKVTIES